MGKMPKVTHLIYIGDGKSPKKSDFPESVQLKSMEDVEVIGAQTDNCKRMTIFISIRMCCA